MRAVFALLAVLLLGLFGSSTVLADDHKGKHGEKERSGRFDSPFAVSVTLGLASPDATPEFKPAPPTDTDSIIALKRIKLDGEVFIGVVPEGACVGAEDICDLIDGAVVTVVQNAELRFKAPLAEDFSRTFKGKINGTFEMDAGDGSVLRGTYKGSLEGTLNFVTGAISGTDKAKWQVDYDGGTGEFEGSRGKGTLAAAFAGFFGYGELATVEFEGALDLGGVDEDHNRGRRGHDGDDDDDDHDRGRRGHGDEDDD